MAFQAYHVRDPATIPAGSQTTSGSEVHSETSMEETVNREALQQHTRSKQVATPVSLPQNVHVHDLPPRNDQSQPSQPESSDQSQNWSESRPERETRQYTHQEWQDWWRERQRRYNQSANVSGRNADAGWSDPGVADDNESVNEGYDISDRRDYYRFHTERMRQEQQDPSLSQFGPAEVYQRRLWETSYNPYSDARPGRRERQYIYAKRFGYWHEGWTPTPSGTMKAAAKAAPAKQLTGPPPKRTGDPAQQAGHWHAAQSAALSEPMAEPAPAGEAKAPEPKARPVGVKAKQAAKAVGVIGAADQLRTAGAQMVDTTVVIFSKGSPNFWVTALLTLLVILVSLAYLLSRRRKVKTLDAWTQVDTVTVTPMPVSSRLPTNVYVIQTTAHMMPDCHQLKGANTQKYPVCKTCMFNRHRIQ